MNRDQALEKIKKCLALAKSPNPHEASTALRQAQALMRLHGLTEQDVTLADVCEAKVHASSTLHLMWEVTLAAMIGDAFGCEHFSLTGSRVTELDASPWARIDRYRDIVFVGVGAGPEIAAYAYRVLARQCVNERKAHVKRQPRNCKPITKTARGDQFALGWVIGVRSLVEAFAGIERNQLLLDQYFAAKYPDLQSVKTKNRAVGRNVRDDDLAQGVRTAGDARLDRAIGGGDQARRIEA